MGIISVIPIIQKRGNFKMKRYISILEENDLEESFSTEKPKPESGYIIKRVKKRIGGKVVTGWTKIKKAGVVTKKKKTGLSKAQLKMRAKKASRTKKAHPTAQKKALKKAKKTRALNK
jgi:hypothetical protein